MNEAKYTAPNPAPLSPLLSRIRHRVAKSKLSAEFRPKAMLDIGCGVYPKLILDMNPEKAVGLDRKPMPEGFPESIEYVQQDFSIKPKLELEDESFDLISALAVLEHIEPGALIKLLAEVRRVLRPGGHFIATIPSGIGDKVLHGLAFVGLTSKTNIDEHQDQYNCRKFESLMLKAGISTEEIDSGRFAWGLNIYIKVRKGQIQICE